MKPKVVILLVLVAVTLIIAFQNAQVVTLRLLFWSISMSQIILTLISLVLGFVAGYLTAKLAAAAKKSG